MAEFSIQKVLRIALFTPGLNGRWGLPLLFWGPPGVGKSRMIEDTSRALGLACQVMLGSIRRPEDFGGFPIPVQKGKQTFMEFAPPGWAADIEVDGDGRGLVFVDELSTVEPAVQKALLRMVLDGCLGDHKLPPTIRFVAASNSVEDAVGGYDIGGPLANRFGHLPWDMVDPNDWIEWLIGANGDSEHENEEVIDPAAEEARVMAAWPTAFARAKGIIAAFVKSFGGEYLHKQPEAGAEGRGRAWPSPRTWEMATRALAGCYVHGADEVTTETLLTAFVGAAAVTKLVAFMTDIALPDPEELLDGRIEWKHNPTRLDRTDAVMSACAALVASDRCEKREPRIEALWGIIDAVCEDGVYDLVVSAARAAIATRLAMNCPAKQKALVALNPFLAAADVQPTDKA